MFYKLKDYIYLVAGSLLSALALDMFLAPNKIAPGGASGLVLPEAGKRGQADAQGPAPALLQ